MNGIDAVIQKLLSGHQFLYHVFIKGPLLCKKIVDCNPNQTKTCVLILYINIPNMNGIDAVFQKLLSGHLFLYHVFYKRPITL